MAKKRLNAPIDLAYARDVIDSEAIAVASLRRAIDEHFREAVEHICKLSASGRGRVVTSGMGKAGIIAEKVSATLASTGTPSHFLHPAEAVHGNLGMILAQDILLAFSNSGESEELTRLLPAVRKMHTLIIAITGRPASSLGRAADIVLDIGKIEEPCPLHLAPSSSTTAMLALGDALALTVFKARGLTVHDYARFHPGGALGRKLMRASDLMRTKERLPLVRAETLVGEALDKMTKARGGAAVVIDKRGKLAGIFTDGDFRRLMVHNPAQFKEPVGRHMTSPCRHVLDATMVAVVQELMAEKRINVLPVVDKKMKVVGMLDIQDLVGWPVL